MWIVLQQILKKLYARGTWSLPGPPDHYGLFFGDSPEYLDENAIMFKYKLQLDEVVFIFWKLTCRNSVLNAKLVRRQVEVSLFFMLY